MRSALGAQLEYLEVDMLGSIGLDTLHSNTTTAASNTAATPGTCLCAMLYAPVCGRCAPQPNSAAWRVLAQN